MKVSIITPVYLHETDQRRQELFERCVKSVRKQEYNLSDVEHLIVNDGSTVSLGDVSGAHVRVIDQPNLNRIIAFARGMKEAKGDIICFLDSDDEYEPNYVSKVVSYFEEYPDYKLFNFGATMIYADGGIQKRDAFKPKELEVGHEVFGGGKIINGTFAFHRSIYEDLGGFPEDIVVHDIDCTSLHYGKVRDLTMLSPYDFSAYAQVEFPEIRKFFMVNHEEEPKHKIIKELGNPFGNDFYLFYKYTRAYHSKPIDDYLLRVNLKS